jgi:signal transduction histidine kinase
MMYAMVRAEPLALTVAGSVGGGLEELTLQLLRERERNLSAAFHLQRVLHDLANHFHAIELRVSFLRSQPSGTPEVLGEVMQSCTQAGARISTLADQAALPCPEDDRALILPALEQAAALAHRDGATVAWLPGLASLPPVRIAALELAVLFVLLFDNAREAGGRVVVDATADSERVTLLVSDDGCGIPDGAAAKIWKPFFTTKGEGHHGHGLAMVRQTLARRGGSIDVQSGGSGTCFVITLRR